MALVPLLQMFSTWLRPMQAWLHDVIPIIPEQNYMPVWIAHTIFALPLAIFLLHNFISEIPGERHRGGARRRGEPRADLLPDRPAAVGAGPRVVRDLPVPLGLERPARRAGLLRRHADVAPLTQRLAELTGNRGQEWQRLTAARVHLARRPADRVLQPAALLRARPAGRLHEGVGTPSRRRAGETDAAWGRAASALPADAPLAESGRVAWRLRNPWPSTPDAVEQVHGNPAGVGADAALRR